MNTISQEEREAAAALWFATVEATDENFAIGHAMRICESDEHPFVHFEQAIRRDEAEKKDACRSGAGAMWALSGDLI